MSAAAEQGLGLLLIVSAPSGAGKTSLVEALLQGDPNLVVSVSHTTRGRRPRERDGINYHFVDAERFAAMVAAGEFLEHAEVFGNHYGTSSRAVDAEREAGRDVVLEIDFQGAAQVRARYPDAASVFILPPSTAELRRRLTNRGEDDPAVIQHRLDKARWEMSHYSDYDFVVVNDHFDIALGDLQGVVRAERLRLARQRERLGNLLSDLLDEP